MTTVKIIKVGGELLRQPRFDETLEALSNLRGRFVVIHGGGPQASDLAERVGLEPRIVDGRRLTDSAMLEVSIMTFAGTINKRLVAALQRRGHNAVGLTGVDGALIGARRRVAADRDWGYVGDPLDDGVDVSLLSMLLERDYVPVIAPLTLGEEGEILNTNADTVASVVATALAAMAPVELDLIMSAPGVLRSSSGDGDVMPTISAKEFEGLIATGALSGGILPKLSAALAAARSCTVRLGDLGILADPEAGTTVQQVAE